MWLQESGRGVEQTAARGLRKADEVVLITDGKISGVQVMKNDRTKFDLKQLSERTDLVQLTKLLEVISCAYECKSDYTDIECD